MLIATFARGEAHCRPLVARSGLAPSFIDPALALLRRHGVEVRLNQRLRKIDADKNNVRSLDFGDWRLAVDGDDAVVLAAPPAVVASLLPNVPVPDEGQAIVNAHFRLEQPITLPDGLPFLGILGGTAQWLFIRGDIVSVTVSAAEDLAEAEAPVIAARLWSDTARALDLDAAPQPPSRIIKERRATFAQTPDNVCKRPRAGTMLHNLVLAGDWTNTGLPATIDGAIQSGQAAAQSLLDASRGP